MHTHDPERLARLLRRAMTHYVRNDAFSYSQEPVATHDAVQAFVTLFTSWPPAVQVDAIGYIGALVLGGQNVAKHRADKFCTDCFTFDMGSYLSSVSGFWTMVLNEPEASTQ